MSKATLIALLVMMAVVASAVAFWHQDRRKGALDVLDRPLGGELTIALTGDTVVTSRLPPPQSDPEHERVVATVRSAALAVTNLEITLSDRARARERPPSAWPIGGLAEAEELKRLGFDVVSRANNHAGDNGVDGLRETGAVLEAVGLHHAGVGDDLDRARLAVPLGVPEHKVSLISVAISSAPESRATKTRGDIKGRPGVNALRFTANITVDPQTFEVLRASAPVLQPKAQIRDAEITLFGRTIKKGSRTVIEFAVDSTDQEEVLEEVASAKRAGAVVLLALHSHEPGNHSSQPADFVRRFAHAAIDRGAALVVGHGPHQLRGIESYGGGVILYSLGNFIFPFEPLASRDADVFDAGVDLHALALGGIEERSRWTPSPVDAAAWWESAVAVATFTGAALSSVRLYPIDLGVDLSPERRGIPRAPTASRRAAIIERVARLSGAFGTQLRIAGDTAVIDVLPTHED